MVSSLLIKKRPHTAFLWWNKFSIHNGAQEPKKKEKQIGKTIRKIDFAKENASWIMKESGAEISPSSSFYSIFELLEKMDPTNR